MLSMTRIRFSVPIAIAVAFQAALAAHASPPLKSSGDNQVPQCVTAGRLTSFLVNSNPALEPRFAGIASHYAHVGRELGLRWDFAFFQMMVETASLTFLLPDGRRGAVRSEQNNFAGIGAPAAGSPGESFADVATGVRAHLEHVKLYAGEQVVTPVAERTRKVQQWGVLASWQKALGRPTTFADLALKWSPGEPEYNAALERTAQRFFSEHCGSREEPAVANARFRHPPTVAEPTVPTQAAEAPPSPMKPPQLSLAQRALKSLTEMPEPTKAPRSALGVGASKPAGAGADVQRPTAMAGVLGSRPDQTERDVAAASLGPGLMPSASRTTNEQAADESLRQLVNGRTVLLDTPIGTVIPIHYQDDGVMQGRAGGLAGYLGAAHDKGRWWIEKSKLCQRWTVWFNGEQQCLKFKQTGQVIHWVSDSGKSGTAKLAP